jgi:hypothetical protein
MTISKTEFDKLMNKFGFGTRNSGDKLAWLEIDGKIVVRTKRSNGSGELPMQDVIRQQLKLNETQLRNAIKCILSRPDYIDILKGKGIL